MKDKRGFSLIKLLIALCLTAILVYLVSVLMSNESIGGIFNNVDKRTIEINGNSMLRGAELYYDTCNINRNKDLDGDDCLESLISKKDDVYDISGTSDIEESTKVLKSKLKIKSEMPDIDKITKLKLENGEVMLSYTSGKYTCDNFNDKLSVTCKK